MPYLAVTDASLYYELSGPGRPAFVFVHGGMCNHKDWANQVQALSRDFTVLTTDLRGHGFSKAAFADCHIEQWADDVNALIDALRLGPVVLVGHSMASRVVVEAASRRPENVGAVVLLDGSRSHGGFAAKAPAPDSVGAHAPATLAQVLDVAIGPYADAATRAHVFETMSSAPPELMQAAVETMKAWDLGRADKVFASLRPDMPMSAIQSTYHDQFTPRYSLSDESGSTPYLDFIKSVRPTIQIKILPETGHFSMLEKPDEVTALIEGFGRAAFQRLTKN